MGIIDIKPERKSVKIKGKSRVLSLYKEDDLKKFSPAALGVGNIGARSRQTDVIAVVFDLTGFTRFCDRADTHLVMPKFLKEFLKWLFGIIKSILEVKRFEEGVRLYSKLPFFAKFTGDGVLFLWDKEDMDMDMICNIVIGGDLISERYKSDFVPKIGRHLTGVPEILKCGVALGQVCSVGNRKDYVGPCINLASKLQKQSNIRFCCSSTGIDLERGMTKSAKRHYTTKIVQIWGIGRPEIVIIRKKDFKELLEKEKRAFKEV